jgi:hypothetical protein
MRCDAMVSSECTHKHLDYLILHKKSILTFIVLARSIVFVACFHASTTRVSSPAALRADDSKTERIRALKIAYKFRPGTSMCHVYGKSRTIFLVSYEKRFFSAKAFILRAPQRLADVSQTLSHQFTRTVRWHRLISPGSDS